MNFIFKNLIQKGHLRINDANGKVRDYGAAGAKPFASIKIHKKGLLFKLPINFTLYFGEAYMNGEITMEEGTTLFDLLTVFCMNYGEAPTTGGERLITALFPIIRRIQQYNPTGRSKENVAHHYDLSAELYKKFLDPDMQYSCAYFTDVNNSLEEAQLDKKKHLASKMLLEPGMTVLDIGSGWGGLAIYLAQNYGADVTGLTLSGEQHKLATERVKQLGLEKQVRFLLRDYRHEVAQYDRIVSVGMFEHVGVLHYREFFQKVKELLKPSGVALLHSIGRMDGPGATSAFIRKYIFPGGYAPALSEVLPVVEKIGGLWATDIEILRLHYAETLARWRANFEQHREEIAELYDERFCRMWELYLVGGEMDFRYMYTMNFQLQITRDINAVPLTRDYMFEAEAAANQSANKSKAA